MRRVLSRLTLSALLCLGIPHAARAAPLRLEEVLVQIEDTHPDMAQVQARAALARAELTLAESQDDARLSLEGSLRTGRNALTGDKFEPDNLLKLNLRKTLWDAGRGDADTSAARLELAGREALLLDARARRRLELMTRFFDVLLADLQYTADDEGMAVAYVSWDNARERHQLGELSNPALAELEARFQDMRLRRNATLRGAKEKRALLASAMNRPGDLPAELHDPDLSSNNRALPDFDALWQTLQTNNPRLLAQRRLIEASSKRLEGLRGNTRPTVELEAEAATYSRDTYTRDTLLAGINLVWPIDIGGETAARRAREQAEGSLARAQYDTLVLGLRQALFETREEIVHLRDTERRAAAINAVYRDWMLERARAEYEMEMKTNLGNTMAETQAAKLRARAVEYRLALAWERLEGLIGGGLAAIPVETKK
jgi:outer membrane protein TolC